MISNSLILNWSAILFNVLIVFFWFLISIPKTCIFFDLYSKFEIFISKQKIVDWLKYFENAAADAPEKDPLSKILIFFFLDYLNDMRKIFRNNDLTNCFF